MKIEIYSDVACPWCYIGKTRFEQALERFDGRDAVEVTYRPYQLDPDAPRTAVPMYEYLTQRFGPGSRGMAQRVIDLAREDGLTMDYDRGLAANTFDAHRVMWLAGRENGVDAQRALANRLFEAHFSEGRDIGDAGVLAQAAESVGMNGDRVRTMLAGNEGVAQVRKQITDARQLGISAVPTFVIDGKYAVQGAQPVDAFREVLETVARE